MVEGYIGARGWGEGAGRTPGWPVLDTQGSSLRPRVLGGGAPAREAAAPHALSRGPRAPPATVSQVARIRPED